MTIEELRQLMHRLHLDADARPQLIYLFYVDDCGLVNNLSISLHSARQRNRQPMTAAQLAALMQQYPAARDVQLLALEHPQQGLTRWLDVHDVCRLLHTTDKTLRRWTRQGLLHPSRTGRRLYYDSAEVDALLRSNIIQPNGRADLTGTE